MSHPPINSIVFVRSTAGNRLLVVGKLISVTRTRAVVIGRGRAEWNVPIELVKTK